MKEMTLKNVTFLCLFLLGWIQLNAQVNPQPNPESNVPIEEETHCITIGRNLICESVNSNNFTDVRAEIEAHYNSIGNWSLEFEVINGAIGNLLWDISSTVDNEDCNPGEVNLMDNVKYEEGSREYYSMRLRWPTNELPNHSTLYFAKYLNLENISDTVEASYDPSFDPPLSSSGVELTIPDTYLRKLYVMNAHCGQDVISDYYLIIIIDRDITFRDETTNGDVSEKENKDHPELVRLEMFPNPILDDNVELKFNLPTVQKISIQLIEGSTGKQLKMILPEQFLKEGAYSEKVNLNELGSGVYYLVLQTNEERIVKKIVKI